MGWPTATWSASRWRRPTAATPAENPCCSCKPTPSSQLQPLRRTLAAAGSCEPTRCVARCVARCVTRWDGRGAGPVRRGQADGRPTAAAPLQAAAALADQDTGRRSAILAHQLISSQLRQGFSMGIAAAKPCLTRPRRCRPKALTNHTQRAGASTSKPAAASAPHRLRRAQAGSIRTSGARLAVGETSVILLTPPVYPY